jgi:hypothetical protein
MSFAELTGATVYVVHLSCREALERALAARERGVRVFVETLIQYLVLDKTWAEKPGFEGAKYVMSPPLRDAANQAVLWDGLASGLGWASSARLGSVMGAIKIERKGTQNHRFTPDEFASRFQEAYGFSLP